MRGSRFPGLSLFVPHVLAPVLRAQENPAVAGGDQSAVRLAPTERRAPFPALDYEGPETEHPESARSGVRGGNDAARASDGAELEISSGDDHRADDHRPGGDDQGEGLEPADMAFRRLAAPQCRQQKTDQ